MNNIVNKDNRNEIEDSDKYIIESSFLSLA